MCEWACETIRGRMCLTTRITVRETTKLCCCVYDRRGRYSWGRVVDVRAFMWWVRMYSANRREQQAPLIALEAVSKDRNMKNVKVSGRELD